MVPSLILPSDQRTHLCRDLADIGRVRIGPALQPDAADGLRAELASATIWSRSMRQGDMERELDAATLAKLTPNQLAAIESMALKGDDSTFRFMHDAIRISSEPEARRARGMLIDRFADELNSQRVLAFMSELVGEPVSRWGGDATRYLPGHFLTTHNDGRKHGKRVLAMVLNLSEWHIDWGGLTLFHAQDGQVATAWVPHFNTMSLFTVPQNHSVSWVTPLARCPRFAIAGWFYAD